MKKIVLIFIIVLVFIISIRIGMQLINSNTEEFENDIEENDIEKEDAKIQDETNIIKNGEIQTEGIYELAINMTKQQDVNLYYKIITSKEEYEEYKNKIPLPDISAEDFKNDFVIILNNENPRAIDETDLRVYKVFSDDSNTYIVMKQKDNPTDYLYYNVYYAIVDKAQLKENIIIKIEK